MDFITPEKLLQAYANGYFPMADPDEDDAVYWYRPDPRAIVRPHEFHVSRRLRRTIQQGRFRTTVSAPFGEVIAACADREETWLSSELIDLYAEVHSLGFAHAVGAYEDDRLVGGVYGVAIGRAFFAESMFHRARDASKIALAALAAHLADRGYRFMDIQFMTEHLRGFGAYELPVDAYEAELAKAVVEPDRW